jgi:hypothetical protein
LIPDIILSMKIRLFIISIIFLSLIVGFALSLPAQAAPAPQQFATNTPLPDGRILYKVQPGDTCIKIGLLNNISVEQLRQLNTNISTDCSNLGAGTLLLIGTGGPSSASATPGPSPTPEPPTITPTPLTGTTEICVLLYDDLNGDAFHQTTEPVIPGGAISVTEINGKYSKTLDTAINPDPNAYQGTCFVDVPAGKYNIGAAIPDNYNPTMSLTYALEIKAGDIAFVPFGAQARDAPAAEPSNTDGGSGPSPFLGLFGGILLLGGLALGFYALRLRAPESKLKRSGLLKK